MFQFASIEQFWAFVFEAYMIILTRTKLTLQSEGHLLHVHYSFMTPVTKLSLEHSNTDESTHRSWSSTVFHVASGSEGKVNILTFWTDPVSFR